MYYNSTKKKGVLISLDTFKQMLEERRAHIEKCYQWTIPDIVWDEYMEFVDELQGEAFSNDPDKNDPSYIVDNIAVNGDYGELDDYKEEGESDEDAIARLEGEALRVYPEERYVIMSI